MLCPSGSVSARTPQHPNRDLRLELGTKPLVKSSVISVLVIGYRPVFLLQVKRRLDLETDHQYLAGSSGPFRGRGRHPGKGTH